MARRESGCCITQVVAELSLELNKLAKPSQLKSITWSLALRVKRYNYSKSIIIITAVLVIVRGAGADVSGQEYNAPPSSRFLPQRSDHRRRLSHRPGWLCTVVIKVPTGYYSPVHGSVYSVYCMQRLTVWLCAQ